MTDRFVSFLLMSRWAAAIAAVMYHVRCLLFVDYDAVHAKTNVSTAFYFLTGLGHESFAVFFILDGVVAGLILHRRSRPAVDRAAVSRHLSSLFGILLPTLILGLGLDLTGVQLYNRHGVYTAFPEFSTLTLTYSSLLGNLVMLQPFVVPTFGSNSMLYLLSYLFWNFVVAVLFVGAAALRTPRPRFAQILLLTIVLLIMPPNFLFWAAIWLAGVAVVGLGESRRLQPPVAVAIVFFVGALVGSRLIGSNTSLLPQPFGEWLAHYKYLFVGLSFAAVTRALYPDPRPGNNHGLPCPLNEKADSRDGRSASFLFFCHIPVIMLLIATGSALLDKPLLRQPTLAGYGEFAALVGACLGTLALFARALTHAPRRWPARQRK